MQCPCAPLRCWADRPPWAVTWSAQKRSQAPPEGLALQEPRTPLRVRVQVLGGEQQVVSGTAEKLPESTHGHPGLGTPSPGGDALNRSPWGGSSSSLPQQSPGDFLLEKQQGPSDSCLKMPEKGSQGKPPRGLLCLQKSVVSDKQDRQQEWGPGPGECTNQACSEGARRKVQAEDAAAPWARGLCRRGLPSGFLLQGPGGEVQLCGLPPPPVISPGASQPRHKPGLVAR